MSNDEDLIKAAALNAELREGAKADRKRIDDIVKRVDNQIARNHFAEVFYETMRRRESKA